jgi:hypothetical protein
VSLRHQLKATVSRSVNAITKQIAGGAGHFRAVRRKGAILCMFIFGHGSKENVVPTTNDGRDARLQLGWILPEALPTRVIDAIAQPR